MSVGGGRRTKIGAQQQGQKKATKKEMHLHLIHLIPRCQLPRRTSRRPGLPHPAPPPPSALSPMFRPEAPSPPRLRPQPLHGTTQCAGARTHSIALHLPLHSEKYAECDAGSVLKGTGAPSQRAGWFGFLVDPCLRCPKRAKTPEIRNKSTACPRMVSARQRLPQDQTAASLVAAPPPALPVALPPSSEKQHLRHRACQVDLCRSGH